MGFFRRRTSVSQSPTTASSSTTPTTASAPPAPPVTPAPVEGATQQLDGIALHYQTWGAPNANRTVLLIHGLTANHKAWALLGPHLADAGYFVIAPDLRGRGLSSKPAQGYSVAFHAADLLGLLDALGVGEADVVGHSLGAAIAMYLSAVYPARVRKLVMIDAGGKIPEDTAQAISASVSRLGMNYPSLDAFLALMRQLPMITEWSPLWEEYFRYDVETRADGAVASRVPKAAIEEESLALALMRTEALPDLVRKPTLLVRATVGLLGPDRGFILPREEAERVRDIIAGCQLVEIADTNHYTVITVPAFADAVGAFLDSSA
jgi:pimeloyl-ACP methyl ester carboxylesterase